MKIKNIIAANDHTLKNGSATVMKSTENKLHKIWLKDIAKNMAKKYG